LAAAPQMPLSQHTPPDSSLRLHKDLPMTESNLVGQAEKLVDNVQANIEGKDINIGSDYTFLILAEIQKSITKILTVLNGC
jgi:hypothetical protein